MGWKNALRYVDKLLTKDPSQVDSNLPFGGKIGGVVEFQMTPFIRASVQGGLVKAPVEGRQFIIEAISKLKIGLSGQVYRYYLSKGDSEDDPEVFIQVYCDKDGIAVEALYCHQLTRMYPQTREEQDLFMGKDDCGLGEQEFNLFSEQLDELGYPTEDVCYKRTYGGANHIPPLHGTEVRVDDSEGGSGLSQEIFYMPYARKLVDIDEYLLISTEVLKSKDHKEECEIHVDFMIGLPLELERLKIQ